MKIKAKITEVIDCGDHLTVRAQGAAVSQSKHNNSHLLQLVSIPINKTTERAFHVGRSIEITVRVK